MLYDEQLLERRIDAAGRVTVKLTDLALFMNTTFGVGLPATRTDQRSLFVKLKKHGAVDVRIESLNDEDSVIVIRPEILTLVLDQNIRNAQASFESARDGGGDRPPEAPPSAEIIPIDRHDHPPQDRT